MYNDGFIFVGNNWLPARCQNAHDGTFTCVVKYSQLAQELDLVSLTLRLPEQRVKVKAPTVTPSKPQKEEKQSDRKQEEEVVEAKAQPLSASNNDVVSGEEGEGVYCLGAVVEPQYESFTFDAESREFHGLLTVSAPKVPSQKQRPGVDAVAVLDVSGSMSGDKISLLRKAMRRLVANVGERDRVAFVAFDSHVKVLMPFRTMDESGQEYAYKLIKYLQAGSCTNLSGGLLTGMDLMKNNHKNEVTTVLLFTDGQANEGISDPQGIIQAALRVVGKGEPRSWGVNDVSGWLNRLGLGMYAQTFAQNGVDGSMLIHDISDKVLQDDLGVRPFHLNKFSRELQKIRASTSQGEGEVDHFFMQVNTFGFGSDHNAALLKGISNQFDGMYYYMKDEMAIVEGFANCLGGMLSTVAQDIEVTMVPAPGVADFVVCKTDNVTKTADATIVTFADLQAEEKRHLLVHGTLPALKESNSAFPLFQCAVKYRNLVEDKDCNLSATCCVNRKGARGRAVENVDVSRNRIEATEAMSEAEKLGNMRDLEGARRVIKDCMAKISSSVSADNEFCKSVLKDLEQCLDGLKSQHAFQNAGQQYMAQNVVCHSHERAANFDSTFSSQITYNNAAREDVVGTFRRRHRCDSFGGVAPLFDDFEDDDDIIIPVQTAPANVPRPKKRRGSFNGVASLFGDEDFGTCEPPAVAKSCSGLIKKPEPTVVDNNDSLTSCDDSGDLQSQRSVPVLGFE